MNYLACLIVTPLLLTACAQSPARLERDPYQQAGSEIASITADVRLYKLKFERWPASIEEVQGMSAATFNPYDPWGNSYRVSMVSVNGFEVRSAGADGIFDSEDDTFFHWESTDPTGN